MHKWVQFENGPSALLRRGRGTVSRKGEMSHLQRVARLSDFASNYFKVASKPWYYAVIVETVKLG